MAEIYVLELPAPSCEYHVSYEIWSQLIMHCLLSDFRLFFSLLDFFRTAQTLLIRCSYLLLSCHPLPCLWLHCLHTGLAPADQILETTAVDLCLYHTSTQWVATTVALLKCLTQTSRHLHVTSFLWKAESQENQLLYRKVRASKCL